MKYTIELTKAERDIISGLIVSIRDNILGEHRLFENTTLFKFDEKSTDYDAVYHKGYEDGRLWAIDANAKDHQGCYNNALEDVNHAIDVLENMTETEREEWFEDYASVGEVIRVFTIQRIIESTRAYEEKKKADEESIKVGDEVYLLDKNHPIVVTCVDADNIVCLSASGKYSYYVGTQRDVLKKTGRHLDEVEQLFDKLRGENN